MPRLKNAIKQVYTKVYQMTATAHALVGGAVASTVGDPVLGIGLSTAFHPMMDLIPHWDAGWGWRKKTKTRFFSESAFDLILGLGAAYILAYYAFTSNPPIWYFLGCILASEIWDILEAPYWFLKWRKPPFSTVYNFQSKMQGKARLPWGLWTQVMTVTGIILMLKYF